VFGGEGVAVVGCIFWSCILIGWPCCLLMGLALMSVAASLCAVIKGDGVLCFP